MLFSQSPQDNMLNKVRILENRIQTVTNQVNQMFIFHSKHKKNLSL